LISPSTALIFDVNDTGAGGGTVCKFFCFSHPAVIIRIKTAKTEKAFFKKSPAIQILKKARADD
jgi:hypothetical protein